LKRKQLAGRQVLVVAHASERLRLEDEKEQLRMQLDEAVEKLAVSDGKLGTMNQEMLLQREFVKNLQNERSEFMAASELANLALQVERQRGQNLLEY